MGTGIALKRIATRLYELNLQAKEIEKEAEEIKKILRKEIPEEGIEIEEGVVVKKVSTTKPVIDNEKLYSKLTYQEIVKVTTPVVGKLKEVLGDTYEEILAKIVEKYTITECIKIYDTTKK